MRIEALPPLHLRQHVAAITRSRVIGHVVGSEKARKKQKSGRITRSLDESMSYLNDELEKPSYEQIESFANDAPRNTSTPDPKTTETPPPTSTTPSEQNTIEINNTKPNTSETAATENSTGPDYDPELDMGDARHKEAYQELTQHHTTDAPAVSAPTRATATQHISPHLLFLQNTVQRQRITDDRFSYMTLIEAILFYHLLYKEPKIPFNIKFGTYKLLHEKKELHSLLVFHHKKTIFAKYKLVFNIHDSRYHIFDLLEKKSIGALSYNVVENLMEDAKGQFYNRPIQLDPVWNTDDQKIRYQDIRLGDYHLDLTAVSRDHRKGQWHGPIQKKDIPFDVLYTSMDYNKHHIRTKKTITMGQHKITLTLKFFDDAFTEPYAAGGRCT